MFCTSIKYVYQYGDATAVVQDGSEQNPIFIFIFLFRTNLIIIIIATLKSNFKPRIFLFKSKGDCLFYVVELDFLVFQESIAAIDMF